jgi:hypothetical protein
MRSTNLVLSLLCIASLAACSKNRSDGGGGGSTTQAQGGTVSDELVINDDFVASKDDKAVRVNSVIAGSLGIVRLDGKDAETLYNALAVNETSYPESEKNEASIARIGKNIECYQDTEKSSGKISHSCVYYFDYKTGEAKVRSADARIERDASIDLSLTNDEGGGLLMNVPSHQGLPAASIQLSGENAKIIYEGLERDGNDADGRVFKDGKNLYCYTDGEDYGCLIDINYRSGEALKNEAYGK